MMILPRRFRIVLVVAILAMGLPLSAHATEPVDLELALAVDVSGSIDEDEAALQRAGYIAAFRDPGIVKAIRSGMLRRIAVAYYEWAGFGHMKIIADWTVIHDAASARAFAARLTIEPPETARRTAIAEAINFAVPFIENNAFEGTRRVVDISGDGPNNWGGFVSFARDNAVAKGMIINGLAIMNDRPTPSGRPAMADLDLYYRNCVIGGPGSFLVVARDFKDFAKAIRRKLILEIAGVTPEDGLRPGLHPVAAHGGAGRVIPSCDDGEFRSRRRWGDSDDF